VGGGDGGGVSVGVVVGTEGVSGVAVSEGPKRLQAQPRRSRQIRETVRVLLACILASPFPRRGQGRSR
jgi:hypothetical protein